MEEGSHIPEEALLAYVTGLSEDRAATAVETHLEWCPRCRARVADMSERGRLPGVDEARLTRIWAGVESAIAPPPKPAGNGSVDPPG